MELKGNFNGEDIPQCQQTTREKLSPGFKE
jgi:hypothetical protein